MYRYLAAFFAMMAFSFTSVFAVSAGPTTVNIYGPLDLDKKDTTCGYHKTYPGKLKSGQKVEVEYWKCHGRDYYLTPRYKGKKCVLRGGNWITWVKGSRGTIPASIKHNIVYHESGNRHCTIRRVNAETFNIFAPGFE